MHFKQTIFLTLSWIFVADARWPPWPPSAPQSIQWVDCAQDVPSFFVVSNITVPTTDLPSTLKCGKLVVPMDYEKEISASNNITLSIAMNRPVDPKGVIFYSGGGGDPNTVVAWEVALGVTKTFDQLLDYDLMFMDSRGTFDSNPVKASEKGIEAVAATLELYLAEEEAWDAAKKYSAAFIKDVQENSTPPGFAQFCSAREVARDYDQIRIALGYEQIHFLALSYGSYRASQYAAYYPERVGNFVLDAVIPHNLSPYDQAIPQTLSQNRALERADAYCVNNSSCPFHKKGKGAVIAAYKKLLSIAPIPAPACATVPCNTSVDAFSIQLAVSEALQSSGVDFPTLYEMFEEALNGDASQLGSSGGLPSTLNIFVVGTIILECGDNNFPDTSFADWERNLKDVKALNVHQIAVPLSWQLQLGCLAWPYPTPRYAPLDVKKPMLLVTSDFDGAAPTEYATIMFETQYTNSVLAVRHGDDHVSFSLTDQPSTAMSIEFLRTGKLPTAQNSVEGVVSVYTPGMKRAGIPDPYMVPTGEVAGDVNSGNLTEEAILP